MAQIKELFRSETIDCIVIERQRRQQYKAARRVILQRREQDKAGYWHTSTHFRTDDIPELIILLSQAHRALTGGGPETRPSRPVDLDLGELDMPSTRELHDAILASQIRR